MKREYSKTLKVLLEKWDDASTLYFVGVKGVMSRDWYIQCLEAGVVDRRKWKQRQIAQKFKMTIARVSKILKDVKRRLLNDTAEWRGLSSVRGYRKKLHIFLREYPVRNAIMGSELVDLLKKSRREGGRKYLGGKYYFEFIVNGCYLRSESLSYFRSSADGEFWQKSFLDDACDKIVVFWMEEDRDRVGNVNLHWEVSAVRSAKWLFFYDNLFWVIDKVIKNNKKENSLAVHLKPAEHDFSNIKW